MADSKKYDGSQWEHSLRKLTTATEIIIPPTTIYADGNNATVGIGGNTVQSGTPTPDNPIMPQGTGDLETVGAKAGQYKIPISSGDVTTPVYLGEGQTMRQIKKFVLTGEETWYSSGTYTGSMYAYNSQFAGIAGNKPIFCSHLQYASDIADYSIGKCRTDDNSVSLWIFNTTTSPASFKTYLQQQYAAGTPVTVWYVLATKETAAVNEPLMKIGDYADTVSGITIPTITSKDTFDVDTTLKPSEVSLSYTGWHDTTVEEWDGSQWQ